MDNKNFQKLVEEVRKHNYIKAGSELMTLSFKNNQKLKDKGFEINDDIVEKLMDIFHDEKFSEAKNDYVKKKKVYKIISKPLIFLIQISLLILFMMLIYFLTPSLKNNYNGQDRDSGEIQQMYYK